MLLWNQYKMYINMKTEENVRAAKVRPTEDGK